MKLFASILLMLTVAGFAGRWLTKSLPVATSKTSDESTGDDVSDPPGTTSVSDALPVRLIPVEAVHQVRRHRQFSGTVRAARRTQLAFERSARLTMVNFDEGQSVTAGQVIAEIDQRQLKVQEEELLAGLQQQQAVLAELQAGPRQETIAAVRAELSAVTADAELRLATFERFQNLAQRKATSAQELDEMRLSLRAADARREAVQEQLRELNAGTRSEQIRGSAGCHRRAGSSAAAAAHRPV
ncbi:MAG: biotin/lipoyl-binding protein [Planctomycetaceae bacterium]